MALMKKTSGIINISRGGVINENDLYEFLKKGKIAFGALDVFVKEPINKKNKLMKLKNCILSSHNAFNTAEEVRNVNINTLKNLFKGLKI
jgi:phosphoglycerate dehydrogenase-like enzyme